MMSAAWRCTTGARMFSAVRSGGPCSDHEFRTTSRSRSSTRRSAWTAACARAWPPPPVAGEKVTLQPCGVTRGRLGDRTRWTRARLNPLYNAEAQVINGSDTNFSLPYVLTYPASVTRLTCRAGAVRLEPDRVLADGWYGSGLCGGWLSRGRTLTSCGVPARRPAVARPRAGRWRPLCRLRQSSHGRYVLDVPACPPRRVTARPVQHRNAAPVPQSAGQWRLAFERSRRG